MIKNLDIDKEQLGNDNKGKKFFIIIKFFYYNKNIIRILQSILAENF